MVVMMRRVLIGLLAVTTAVSGTPLQSLNFSEYVGGGVAPRADSGLVGYLGAFFLGADPYVYFYLSNGNTPTSFKALNKGSPVMRPTKGTGGVRDPALVQGGGAEAGRKWYILGTDLNIGKVWSHIFQCRHGVGVDKNALREVACF
jgi:hypothetical protein